MIDSKQLQVGEYIKWTVVDGDVTEQYEGIVVGTDDIYVEFETNVGKMTVPYDDGSFEKLKKAVVLKRKKGESEQSKVMKEKETKKVPSKKRAKKGPTKVDLIVELLRKSPANSRKEAIEKIVEAGITTPKGASTFYNQAKKVL